MRLPIDSQFDKRWLVVSLLAILYMFVLSTRASAQIAFLLVLFILYKFAYLKRLSYYISGEQLIIQHGVFTTNNNYIELYRIVDYDERRSFIQQIVGLKTVTIYSGDRTTPHLDIIGVPVKIDLVAIIRERVEYNKQRKGVYEITNR